jgi:TRAP-type mannitol/chloroaromatic compound transport system permease small subunit
MKIEDYIDRISLWSGKIVRWLAIILSIIVLIEVVMRYVFNNPTDWEFDAAMWIYSTMFTGGAAYVLLIKAHIRVDVIFNMLPRRTQLILDLIYYIVFFFPFLFVMIVFGSKIAILSTLTEEMYLGEPIHPWRYVIPGAFLLLLLQAVAEFIRTIKSLRTN